MRRPWDPAGVETRWASGPGEGAFRVRVCQPGKTADTAVVLIHGVIVSGRYLTPLGAALSRDFAVAIPDLPGFGLSQATMPGQTLAGLADAAVASAAVLGTDRVSLVGNSFGAQVAIEAAVRHPETVERIALIGPTPVPARCRGNTCGGSAALRPTSRSAALSRASSSSLRSAAPASS